MAYEAKIILDSVAENGHRLVTFQVTFPRMVLAEMNTARAFSRNSASSRAIPVDKMIAMVKSDPFIPIYWGKNQKGMQAAAELTHEKQKLAQKLWLTARDNAVRSAEAMLALGSHKQVSNRILEPFMWHTAIISATEYANFFAQRCHPDAQPEIRRIAEMMRDLYDTSTPTLMTDGEWHCPYVTEEDTEAIAALSHFSWIPAHELRIRISLARCARVSYNSQEGKRDVSADLDLFNKLVKGMHPSPMEHPATPCDNPSQWANFKGWRQYRRGFANENQTEYPRAAALLEAK